MVSLVPVGWRFVAPVRPAVSTPKPGARRRSKSKPLCSLVHPKFGHCDILARRWLLSGIAVADVKCEDGVERTLALKAEYWSDDISGLLVEMKRPDFVSDAPAASTPDEPDQDEEPEPDQALDDPDYISGDDTVELFNHAEEVVRAREHEVVEAHEKELEEAAA
jgi:hypothetical protein